MGYPAIFKSGFRIIENKLLHLHIFLPPCKQVLISSMRPKNGKETLYVSCVKLTYTGRAKQIIYEGLGIFAYL